MTEFALVAPVLLLLTFGILDFGRALFFYAATGDAAREGAHVAGRATSPLPTNADVRNAVAVHFPRRDGDLAVAQLRQRSHPGRHTSGRGCLGLHNRS